MNPVNNRRQNHTAKMAAAVCTLGILMGLSLAGCAEEKPKTVVGFSQMVNDTPWRITQTNSIKQEAAKRAAKFELIVTDAQDQTAKQVADVNDLIARKVNAIFLSPREFDALAPALQAAKQAQIPVFLLDRTAAGKPGEDYVTFIGSDFVAQGANAARWLVAETGAKASIVELTGTPGSSVARDRSQGFNEQVKTRPNMKVIASETGDFSRERGQQVMADIIKSKGKQITAVYAHNDQMALGAIEALKAAGMQPGKDVMVISIDGEKAALEAIIKGELSATIESSPRLGPLAFDTLERHLNKLRVQPKVPVEDRLFDKNNAREFVDAAY